MPDTAPHLPPDTAASGPPGPLAQETAAALGLGGGLAARNPQWQPRRVQQQMAAAVATAIERAQPLVVEAGTGVGKTYAYLVPVLLSGRRALVSTATKSLQDQLFLRDLPQLKDALSVPVSVALLKGRASYLCLHRLQRARTEALLPERHHARVLAQVERWSQTTRTGDLAELDGLDERSPVIPLVTSTRDNCLGSECPSFGPCHLMQARREAMAADVVVVNHHLFFADLALRDTGMAELLPTVDVVVLDEAHQIVETGVQFLGRTLATAQAVDLARDALAAGLQQARGLQDWPALAGTLERAARDLRLAAAGRDPDGRGKRRWEAVAHAPAFATALRALVEAATALSEGLAAVDEASPDLSRLKVRAAELAALGSAFGEAAPTGQVRWVDLSTQHARLVQSPLDIRERLAEVRGAAGKAWIFTSATLGEDDTLRWFTEPTGLEDATCLRLASPFDYAANARLLVPPELPRPDQPRHPLAVADLAARCATALGGRTFVLTTTLRALTAIADRLTATLPPGLPVWRQGSAPKRQLLRDFLARGGVLVGSASFWEGIDVPGEALQCVVIDKLPFPPPDDPLMEARARRLKAAGRDAFAELHVPETAVALKQGAGRLIRHETDRGLLVIGDTRLRGMGYGRRLIGALPPMQPLADTDQALAWLHELAGGG